jgi:hypothetical protein
MTQMRWLMLGVATAMAALPPLARAQQKPVAPPPKVAAEYAGSATCTDPVLP